MKKRIIVPTDLSETGDHATRQALLIARRNNSTVTLLHVATEHPAKKEESLLILEEKAAGLKSEYGVEIASLVIEGAVMEAIPFATIERDYDLMVIGTNGIHGFRQKLLGSDMLRLVTHVPVPVLVVQQESRLMETCDRLVLPVSSHTDFPLILDATVFLAQLFNAEVHLYSIIKAGFDWPEQILKNIELAVSRLEEKHIRLVRVKEEQKVYSIGFAKQTLVYAASVGAGAICVISTSSREYYYFAPSDKETLMMNESGIPILFAGGIP